MMKYVFNLILLLGSATSFCQQPGGVVARVLDSVLVIGRRPLMVINKDTIEFNAALFKTLPNAMAGELLKKIPGLIIDDQGRLVFNGRPVNKILVDGKVFFNTDGQVAMKNIPVDLIKKVQISVDEPTLREEGNSIAHQKTQTLNIRLKEGDKFFGNARVSGGTDSRYDLSGLITRSNEREQLSALGGWNNINKVGPVSNTGLSVSALTSGGGITRLLTSGLNYNRSNKDGGELRGTYEFMQPVTYSESVKERRQNFVADSSLLSASVQRFTNTSNSHSVSIEFLKNNLYGTSNFSSSSTNNKNFVESSTSGSPDFLLNHLQNTTISKSKQVQWQTSLGYSIPFTKKGRSLLLSPGYGMERNSSNDINQGSTIYYSHTNPDSQAVIRQQIDVNANNNDVRMGIQYTEPLGGKWQWKMINNFSLGFGKMNRTTWQLDSDGKKQQIDSLYSNAFTSSVLTNEALSGFKYEGARWAADVGMGAQLISWYNKDRMHGVTVRDKKLNLIPQLNISIRKNPVKESLNLSVRTQTINPTKEQLQPAADNSNPLYIQRGNPDLRSSVQYSGSITYNKLLSTKTGASFSMNNTYNFISDKMIPFVIYDSLGRQLSYYVNINGAWSSTLNATTTRRFKKGKNIFGASINAMANFSHDRFYVNGSLLDVNTLFLLPSLHFRYSRENKVEAMLRYAPVHNNTHYQQNPNQDQHFWTQNISGSLDLLALKRLKWKNSISYSYNNRIPEDLDKSSILWNMELSLLCLKNKKGEISFNCFDLLKQNRSISHWVSNNTIEDSQSNNLQRYFMIGFFWQFSQLNQNKQDGR